MRRTLNVRLSAGEPQSVEARIASQRRIFVDHPDEARVALRAFLDALPRGALLSATADSATLERGVVLRWRAEGDELHIVAIPQSLAGSETALAWWINALRTWCEVRGLLAWTARASVAQVPIEGNWPEDDTALFAASDAVFLAHGLTPAPGRVIQSETYFSEEARDASGVTRWTFHVDQNWPWFTEVGVLNVQDPWDAEGEHTLLTEIISRATGQPNLDVIVH